MELSLPALRDHCLQVGSCIKAKPTETKTHIKAPNETTSCSALCVCKFRVHPLCDSEGAEGLNVFYWSQFYAPDDVAMAIRMSSPEKLQRRLPGSNKVQRYSRNEQRYYMEQDEDVLHLLGKGAHCFLHAHQPHTCGHDIFLIYTV